MLVNKSGRAGSDRRRRRVNEENFTAKMRFHFTGLPQNLHEIKILYCLKTRSLLELLVSNKS